MGRQARCLSLSSDHGGAVHQGSISLLLPHGSEKQGEHVHQQARTILQSAGETIGQEGKEGLFNEDPVWRLWSSGLSSNGLDLSDLLLTTSTGLGKALVVTAAMGLMATTRKEPLPGEILAHLTTPSSIQPWAMATTNQCSHLQLPHQSPTRRLLNKDKRRNVTDEMDISSLKVPNQLMQPSHLHMALMHSNIVACTNNANSSHSNIVACTN